MTEMSQKIALGMYQSGLVLARVRVRGQLAVTNHNAIVAQTGISIPGKGSKVNTVL